VTDFPINRGCPTAQPPRDLIATWLRLAIFPTLSEPEGEQRTWFVVDELDALGRIDGLKYALARLRKFGGRCILGFQSIGQISAIYGHGEAQTIIENCGNSAILRCSASEGGGTSRFVSKLIGEREILREQMSKTRQYGHWFGATSISEQHVTESAVLPSEIEQLADGVGYVKFASRPEWIRTRFPDVSHAKVAPAFVPR